jgi:hypothetical protein
VTGNARGTIGRICRWHDETNQVERRMAVALLQAQSWLPADPWAPQIGELAAALARP